MKTATSAYLAAAAVASLTVLLLVFAIGALGIVGEGGREDRGYAVVLAVGAVGTVLARLRPSGMAFTLAAMAAAQVVVTAVALLAGVPDGASVVDILGITAMFATLFGLAAWLFQQAAEPRAAITTNTR